MCGVSLLERRWSLNHHLLKNSREHPGLFPSLHYLTSQQIPQILLYLNIIARIFHL